MVISKAQANTQTNRNTSEDVMLFSCHTKENILVSGVITNDNKTT